MVVLKDNTRKFTPQKLRRLYCLLCFIKNKQINKAPQKTPQKKKVPKKKKKEWKYKKHIAKLILCWKSSKYVLEFSILFCGLLLKQIIPEF